MTEHVKTEYTLVSTGTALGVMALLQLLPAKLQWIKNIPSSGSFRKKYVLRASYGQNTPFKGYNRNQCHVM